nr:uncharacterized protein LOC112927793 [Vulpes vulpes]
MALQPRLHPSVRRSRARRGLRPGSPFTLGPEGPRAHPRSRRGIQGGAEGLSRGCRLGPEKARRDLLPSWSGGTELHVAPRQPRREEPSSIFFEGVGRGRGRCTRPPPRRRCCSALLASPGLLAVGALALPGRGSSGPGAPLCWDPGTPEARRVRAPRSPPPGVRPLWVPSASSSPCRLGRLSAAHRPPPAPGLGRPTAPFPPPGARGLATRRLSRSPPSVSLTAAGLFPGGTHSHPGDPRDAAGALRPPPPGDNLVETPAPPPPTRPPARPDCGDPSWRRRGTPGPCPSAAAEGSGAGLGLAPREPGPMAGAGGPSHPGAPGQTPGPGHPGEREGRACQEGLRPSPRCCGPESQAPAPPLPSASPAPLPLRATRCSP